MVFAALCAYYLDLLTTEMMGKRGGLSWSRKEKGGLESQEEERSGQGADVTYHIKAAAQTAFTNCISCLAVESIHRATPQRRRLLYIQVGYENPSVS